MLKLMQPRRFGARYVATPVNTVDYVVLAFRTNAAALGQ